MNETEAAQAIGDCELAIRRRFAAAPSRVFGAWSDPAQFRQWWAPEGFGITLLACEMDVRSGGSYRLVYGMGQADTLTFHGTYPDVVAGERIVWTNAEDPEGAITTVTFADAAGGTLVTYHERYPTRAARDEALETSAMALPGQLDQLAALLAV
ncbi:SRPBCC domain-containing protein [Novosphingobium fuchskuhlense]|uniref:SRPBCC domain-containing protein n=1 Tax=Novosphingobium fuchskuhlense TaxID=1117702 RepID=UPI0009E98B64|nr:SRPBCC domain-containing protein [Novosphingobium fuchskuhlense]